jgi:mannonate dehydratase
MEMTFRWYGDEDPVTLEQIRQIPVIEGIVSALDDVSVGEVLPIKKISEHKKKIEAVGLKFSVLESIPVHEDIKLGRSSRNKLIENYCQSIRNMGSLGIKILCYNFMPVFDWTRSDLAKKNPDGSTSLSYDHAELKKIDLKKDNLELPGWATSYSKDELYELLDAYSEIDNEQLWSNLEYFLKKVVPVAEKSGVLMAIHPDDPPWSIFGIPRIITNDTALERLVNIVDSESNGLTFCTGSFGPNKGMDLIKSIYKFGEMKRIHFAHVRNIKYYGNNSFQETAHTTESGDINIFKIIKAYSDVGFKGAMRPDHGRMIWGEEGRPGYGLYDRALGAMYLSGLWEALQKNK